MNPGPPCSLGDQRSCPCAMPLPDLHPRTLPSSRMSVVDDHGQHPCLTYGGLVCRKHVFGFVDIWSGVLSRLESKREMNAILSESRTIYGRFAYLATLMVERREKAVAEDLMRGPKSLTMPRQKLHAAHGRGSRSLEGRPFDSTMTLKSSVGLCDAGRPGYQWLPPSATPVTCAQWSRPLYVAINRIALVGLCNARTLRALYRIRLSHTLCIQHSVQWG